MPYYVYMLASGKHGTIYLGVTRDLIRRGYEHRTKAVEGFTGRYGVDKLMWFEVYDDPTTAITREKQLKKWRRDWKIRLIEEDNPQWLDLYPDQLTPWLWIPGPRFARPGMTATYSAASAYESTGGHEQTRLRSP